MSTGKGITTLTRWSRSLPAPGPLVSTLLGRATEISAGPPAVSGTALSQLRGLPVKAPEPMEGTTPSARSGLGGPMPAPRVVSTVPGTAVTPETTCCGATCVVTIKPGSNGCVVLSGTLHEPYGGQQMLWRRGPDSDAAQVDHVVAKGNAYVTGARHLTAQQRTDFANDPLNLLTVAGGLNASKSDRDAASWLPPRAAYRCTYVAPRMRSRTATTVGHPTREESHGARAEQLPARAARRPRRSWMTPPTGEGEQR